MPGNKTQKAIKKNKELEALLESDDELPLDYIEDPDTPAYQMHNRFEQLKFGWIDSNFSKYYQKKLSLQNAKLSVLYSSLNEDKLKSLTDNLCHGEKSLILSGVLAANDIYCLKCIEPTASDSTFLWFINFLLYKDLQSNYSYLKTCLVSATPDPLIEKLSPIYYASAKNYNFDLVVT